MLSTADVRMIRESERAQRRWEHAIARSPMQLAEMPGLYAWNAGTGWLESVADALRMAILGVQSLCIVPPNRFIRRATAACFGATAATLAIASTLAVKGYVEQPAAFWANRLSQRKVSAVYDAGRTLVGAVDTQGQLTPDEATNLAYIPLRTEVPGTFRRAVVAFENKHFDDDSLLNVCGIDVLSLLRPVTSLGRAGGSGIAQQLSKQLMQPEWGSESNVIAKGYRWVQQLGAACSLYRSLGGDAGRENLMGAYASYAPMWQGNGVLRGIEAASRVVFDVEPSALTDAMQLILAASVKEPLRVIPEGAAQIACARVYPRTKNPQFDAETARANRERGNQCRVLHRAISMGQALLKGPALEAAMKELREYQRDGIVPANPFEPISTKKLVNLSTRAKAALPSGLIAQIRQEAEATEPGAELVISLDAVRQHEFSEDMKKALAAVQSSREGRRSLCLPLVQVKTGAPQLRDCGIDVAGKGPADLLALKTDARTGGLRSMYASSPLILDSVQSIGSVAKWAILLAAIGEGYTASTRVCPRRASDGDRPLHRVRAPAQGFADCEGGRNEITFEEAMATSDNLAFYDVSRKLGPSKLAEAVTALGMSVRGQAAMLPYDLSFGTFGATPRELTGAAQALFAYAWDMRVTGTAPRILLNVGGKANPSVNAIGRLAGTPAQRLALRTLLEAPVEGERGTLGVFSHDVNAGKSGSTQSNAVDPTGRRYAHGKWAVTFRVDRHEINLFMVASPLPSLPLAHHAIGPTLFAPAHRVLIANTKENTR